MQVLVRAEAGEENNTVPDEQPTFHHEIDYVIRTWLERKMHHTYPEPGGYNDQDAQLVEDWHTMNMYHIRVEKGVFTEVALPGIDSAPNWMDMGRD